MSLWVDKYRPRILDNLDHHPIVTNQLKTLVIHNNNDIYHIEY